MSILARDSSGLLASGLGSGKTLQGVERVRQLKLGRVPRVLVVAPVNTLGQWRDTFAEQFPSLKNSPYLRIAGTHKSDPESWKILVAKKPGVTLIGWEAMRGRVDIETKAAHSRAATKEPKLTVAAIRQAMKDGTVPPWGRVGVFDLVIGDEIHRIANRNSAQTKILKLIKADHKLAISATFSGNKEEGAWSILNWLWKEKYPRFWDWAEEYLHIEPEKVSHTKTINKIGGELNPGAIWDAIPCGVRHRTEDIGIELPEVIQRIVKVPMGKVQRQQYDDFEQQAFAWLDDHPVGTPLPITQRIRLRQAALGQLKVSEVIKRVYYNLSAPEKQIARAWLHYRTEHAGAGQQEFLEVYNDSLAEDRQPLDSARLFKVVEKLQKYDEGIEFEDFHERDEIDFNEKGDQSKLAAVKEIIADLPDGERVLVWAPFAKWARMAVSSLNRDRSISGVAKYWGDVPTGSQRDSLKAEFIRGDVRILVAHPASMSEGTDGMQYACRCEIIAAPSESALINEQAEGRLYRPGQKSPVQRWILQSEDSIDTDIAETLEGRRSRMRTLYKDDLAA
ncbi:DEAD/DEAH box helicase [Streptomyces sp. 5-10]|nr:DEAD/DEAH box helicase [Streptomyces sp. 5-10]